ncbi:GGDEF domain-containing protein [Actinoplanes sp. NPDC051851]|uniref:GGDEF domain-containing protein n=1 Tax=Actinoplanes sp. NPDC051851 TaxID=3154753 RepID=UPI00344979A2
MQAVSAMRRDPAVLGAIAWTLLAIVLMEVLSAVPDMQVNVFWMAQPPLDALLVYASWRVYRIAEGPNRRFWRLMGVGATLFLTGDVVQTVIALATPGEGSTAGGIVQTVCFATALSLLIIGMLIHPHPDRTGPDRLAFWLDSATVLVGGVVVAWVFAYSPDPTGDTNLIGTLAAGAVVLTSAFAAVKMILSGNAPMHKAAAIPMIASAVVNSIGLFVAPSGSGHLPAYVFAIRLLPSLLVAIGPRNQEIVARFDHTAFGARRRRPYSLLPYGSIVVVFVTLLVVLPDGRMRDARLWGVVVGFGVIIGLVVARQLAAFHDNNRLLRELDHTLTELREHEARLRHQALFDDLTGLANRTHFRVEACTALAADPVGSVSLILVDLDGFKQVNDTLGHAAGDELLIAVAGRLRDSVRSGDLVARLGGDEFAVLLRDCRPGDAEATAERILATMTATVPFGEDAVRANTSIGIATATPAADYTSLTRDADIAMYASKHRGKGVWTRFDPAMTSMASVLPPRSPAPPAPREPVAP